MMYYSTYYSSPLGPLTLASDGEHLAGLWLEGQKYFGDTVSGDMEERAVSYTHLTLPTIA